MMLREYTGEDNLNIDGRNIPYQLLNAAYYFMAKHKFTEDELYKFSEDNYELYQRVNQIIAIKQSCVLLRHTSHSCQSLSDDLFSLKMELIKELKEKFNYEFDEQFMESYPSEEEYKRLSKF